MKNKTLIILLVLVALLVLAACGGNETTTPTVTTALSNTTQAPKPNDSNSSNQPTSTSTKPENTIPSVTTPTETQESTPITTAIKVPEIPPSQGLEFAGSYGSGASLTGIGSCTDKEIVIPYAINGCPIVCTGKQGDGWSSVHGFDEVTGIIFQGNITEIHEESFANYPNLKSITILGDNVKISEDAFRNCTALTEINLPNGILQIEKNAFTNTGYYNNPDNWENGVLYIGNHLIEAKKDIKSCTVKKDTLSIADEACLDCES